MPCHVTATLASLTTALQRYSWLPQESVADYQKTVVTADLDGLDHFHDGDVTDGNSGEIPSDSTVISAKSNRVSTGSDRSQNSASTHESLLVQNK